MDKDAYRRLHRRLAAQGVFAIRNRASAAALLIACAWSGGTIALILHAHGAALSGLQLLLGLSIFSWFVILHECGHLTFVRGRRLNLLIGHVASVFCLIPWLSWRMVHRQHHRWVGVVDRDPTQRSLLRLYGLGRSGTALYRAGWRLWLPVLFAHFIWETYWLHPIGLWRSGDRRRAGLCLASSAACLAPHMALIAFAGPLPWLAGFAPAWIVFLVVFENISIPQHSGLTPFLSDERPDPIPFRDQGAVTRSTRLPTLARLAMLNFNLHAEHHIFPQAPWSQLPRLRLLLAEEESGPLAPVVEVPFPAYVAGLRARDPVVIYRDPLPRAQVSS